MVISQLSEILKGGIIFHCTYIPFSLREDDDTVWFLVVIATFTYL